MKVCITFPVFNGLEYTKKCLASIHRNALKVSPEKLSFDVIIVDDGSTDGTTAWVKKHYPDVHILKGTGNLWWSGGVNKGMQYAFDNVNPDYILWWNNDIIEDNEYFIHLAEVIEEIDSETIIGSKIYMDHTQTTIWSMGGIFNVKTGYKEMIGSGFQDNDTYQTSVECDWLTGMGSAIPRAVFKKVGILDEINFPQYHGDADFTLRAHKAGFKIKVDPRLKIYNDTSNSGLKHDNSFTNLWRSLFSIKSNFNISKDFIFYHKHTTSIFAFRVVIGKYFTYIGGFFKWKVLEIFGLQRK